MAENNGGPAFPKPGMVDEFGKRMGCWQLRGNAGMSLRDWFAGQAMQSMLGDVKPVC